MATKKKIEMKIASRNIYLEVSAKFPLFAFDASDIPVTSRQSVYHADFCE